MTARIRLVGQCILAALAQRLTPPTPPTPTTTGLDIERMLNAYGRGWLARTRGDTTCPYGPDDLDGRESEVRGCIITCAERWRQGYEDAAR